MNEKKKAWVYTRIDAPEDRYGMLKKQDQTLTEYAQHMGWEVVGHSQDLAGGRNINRPGLQALTDAVTAGAVEILVISNVSRISRDIRNIHTYAEFLKSNGIDTFAPAVGRIEELSAPAQEEMNLIKGQKLF